MTDQQTDRPNSQQNTLRSRGKLYLQYIYWRQTDNKTDKQTGDGIKRGLMRGADTDDEELSEPEAIQGMLCSDYK